GAEAQAPQAVARHRGERGMVELADRKGDVEIERGKIGPRKGGYEALVRHMLRQGKSFGGLGAAEHHALEPGVGADWPGHALATAHDRERRDGGELGCADAGKGVDHPPRLERRVREQAHAQLAQRRIRNPRYKRHTRNPWRRNAAASHADLTSMRQPWRTIFAM